ncbi:MAG: lipoate--protein ligase [Clostridium sp.]|uniref:lipoate--protein ligase n=1 Tax=Clostridium sp. TaxID=1506 RepID=UPI002FC8E6BF
MSYLLIVKHDYMSPAFNHAVEDYLMENFNEDCFILWRNTKSILIGKNQNTLSEINLDYVKEKDIFIVRRMSGGGAVFCDPGNLNFTFISAVRESKFADFESFTRPIINALKSLNIKDVEFSGRNDITIDSKKISGNAQYRHKDKILHHGTLLYSADLSELIGGLNVRPIKFKDKAVKSVASRVTNINQHMENPMDVADFKEYIINYVYNSIEGSKIYTLTDKDVEEINKIVDSKYNTWEWNYGKSPEYDYKAEDKFKAGIVEVYLTVDKGLIKKIKFFGDFFGSNDISILEDKLTGVKHKKEDIEAILRNMDITDYIKNIEVEELVDLMFR